ncbi:MAG TPA: DUF885 domain-containing protein [Acidobacteriaceae bacterium]|nr:DUF885 domain-containing protein [Acidobacteriaceae bacterium]
MKIRYLPLLAGGSIALLTAAIWHIAHVSAAEASPAASSNQQATADWHRLVDQYFDQVYLPCNPTAGTSAGLHQYDDRLENYSRASLDQQIRDLHAYGAKVAAFPASKLSAWDAGDRAFLLGNIRSQLLTLEKIRPWQKNPDWYSSGLTNSAFTIIERNYAPSDVRLKALIAREQQMPAMLQAARTNLENPPKIYTQIALEQLPGIVSFFQKDIPAAFSGVQDRALLAQFHSSNEGVVRALTAYQQWLQTALLPRSNGDFRIGAENFSAKLQDDEMIDIPLERLLQIANADLHKNQEEFRRVAQEIDPDKTPMEMLASLQADHPAPDQLLNKFQLTFNNLIQFIRTKNIVTIASDVQPTLENTPPFMRATTFASMDSPGAYEQGSHKAYFNVTVPSPNESPQQIAESMAAFNIGTIVSTSIHEAYPGHYVQFLFMPQVHSRVRKMLYASSVVEGWAHYCEQMMLDEGYGQPGWGAKDAREAKLIRLGQLDDALLRDARFIVGIQMHAGQMTVDQAVDFFEKQGYQTRANGLVEAKRGTADPTYLYYTLGKLMIVKLRHDLQQKEGAAFSLRKFHDDFLRQGGVPVPLVRRALLHNDSPVL